jgi:hypothetical protein
MWLALSIGPDEMHLVPDNDLIEHTTSDECVCGPATTHIDDGLIIIIHMSLDGREHSEPDWKG